MKKCKSCGEEKPENYFTKNSAIKDGLSTYCKACYRIYRRRHRVVYNLEKFNDWVDSYHKRLKTSQPSLEWGL